MKLANHIKSIEEEEQKVLQKQSGIPKDQTEGSLWKFYDNALTCIHALKEWHVLKLKDTVLTSKEKQTLKSYENILGEKLQGYAPELGDLIRLESAKNNPVFPDAIKDHFKEIEMGLVVYR